MIPSPPDNPRRGIYSNAFYGTHKIYPSLYDVSSDSPHNDILPHNVRVYNLPIFTRYNRECAKFLVYAVVRIEDILPASVVYLKFCSRITTPPFSLVRRCSRHKPESGYLGFLHALHYPLSAAHQFWPTSQTKNPHSFCPQ